MAKAVHQGPLVNLINTPLADDTKDKLLSVKYLKANKNGPEFSSLYNNTEQKIDVDFSTLEVLLHQEALLNIMEYIQNLQLEELIDEMTKEGKRKTEEKEQQMEAKKVLASGKVVDGDSDIIDVAIHAKLNEFALGICNEKVFLAEVKVKGLQSSVIVQPAKMTVKAHLEDIVIYDPTANSLHPKIVSVVGNEVFRLDVAVYNNVTDGEKYNNIDNVDVTVEFHSQCMKIIFLNKFVMDLLAFADNFQAAKDRLAEAGAKALEASIDAAQNIYQKAPRVILGIQIKAPVIIVPQNRHSSVVLIADLGLIQVFNSFKVEDKKNSAGMAAILDTMNVTLTDLQVSRCHMDKGEVVAECLILDPVTIQLEIVRNLSPSWYFDKPEVNISGCLEAVQVCLSQGDFTTIMTVITQNILESMPPPSKQGSTSATRQRTISTQSEEGKQDRRTSRGIQPLKKDEPHMRFCFSFEFVSLSAALYSGESTLQFGKGQRDSKKALGKFELQTIAANAVMMSDTSLNASVILKNCVLDDTRYRPDDKIIISRLIERAEGPGHTDSNRNMIDLTVIQDSTLNKEVAVKVHSINVCICLEYLKSLADFFINGLPEMPKSQPTRRPEAEAVSRSKDGTQLPLDGDLRLTINVEKPEIILVEDTTDYNTNAFILRAGIDATVHQSQEFQQISGTVRELEIISCVYAKERRASTSTKILYPCEISLHGKAPQGRGHHIDVMMTDVLVNISPYTIRLMSSIAATLSVNAAVSETFEEHVWENLWKPKAIRDSNLKFLEIAKSLESSEVSSEDDIMEINESLGETVILTVSSVTVNIEAMVGKRTVPLLILETSASAEVKDWSSKLMVKGSVNPQIAYYNEKLSVWESLLEPLEEPGFNCQHRPYELSLEVKQNDDLPEVDPDGDSVDTIRLPPPKMSISVTSDDMMQITVTKTCLEVIDSLTKGFKDAYNRVEHPSQDSLIKAAPYVLKNESGIPITVKVDDSLQFASIVGGLAEINPGDVIPLFPLSKKVTIRSNSSHIKQTQEGIEKNFILTVPRFNVTRPLAVIRAEKRSFDINHVTYPGDLWAMVCDVQASIGSKTIIFRSIVQVHNQLNVPLEVYYDKSGQFASIVPGERFSVPIDSVYSDPSVISFKPVGTGYKKTTEEMLWKTTRDGHVKTMECCSMNRGHPSYFFNVRTEIEDAFFEDTNDKLSKCFTLHVHPTVLFKNSLPCEVTLLVEGTEELTVISGERIPLDTACMGKTTLEIILRGYLQMDWSLRLQLSDQIKELSVQEFEAYIANKRHTLDLAFLTERKSGNVELNLYAPYWMINNTSLPLMYKHCWTNEGSDGDVTIDHPVELDDAVLFSFKPKALFAKKKASLKVLDSDWSDKFSLDTVGSSGKVTCKTKGFNYEFGVSIKLGHSGLTKIVVFTPYYLLINKSKTAAICCAEVTGDALWVEVPSNQCVPFWPKSVNKKVQLKAKVKDEDEETAPFLVNRSNTSLLKLNSKYGGINVDIQISEASVLLTLNTYEDGMADVLVVNNLINKEVPVSYGQKDEKQSEILKPGDHVLYAWCNPQGKRELVWTCGDKKDYGTILKDEIFDFFLDSEDSKAYQVSFLYGEQRVLLFTEDIALALAVQEAGELERLDVEMTLSLHGLGLSLVDNYKRTEVAYMAITSSGIIWEEKKKRFKALNLKQCKLIENAWQIYQMELTAGRNPKPYQKLDAKLEVDFTPISDSLMMMYKPNTRPIRRSFQSGVWLQYKTSTHQLQFHAKINKIQSAATW